MENNSAVSKPKGLTPTHWILISGIVVIVAAIIVVAVLFLKQPEPVAGYNAPAGAPAAGNVVIDENNVVDEIAKLQREAAEGYLSVKMNSTWSFPDGKSASTDAYVANSTSNRLPMYFTITLGETEDVVYTSPKLELGEAVEKVTLSTPLEAGVYDAVCNYNILAEDGTIKDTVGVTVILNVKA